MSTTLYSDVSVGARPRWRALGIDADGCWHTGRAPAAAPDEVVVTDGTGVRHRQYIESASDWVEAIAAEAGWQAHTEAQPGAGLLDEVTA
jgi:hypothetical protein